MVTARPSGGPQDVEQINFSWLLKLRWGAIAGQVVTILGVDRIMHIPLPLVPLLAIVAVELSSNVLYAVRIRSRRPIRDWEQPAVMGLDVLLLTGLLYFTGGPFNPFSFLYLVQIALAAVVLRARWTWGLVALSLACSGVLFLYHRDLPLTHAEHMNIHLQGMWVAFGVAASFIVYFLMRITRALAEREAELEASRREAARGERLVSLATLAAGAAHELATPLSTIALVARELERSLENRPADSPAREDVLLIREQVQRCRAILDQMAVEAGQSAGENIVAVSLDEIVRGAVATLGDRPPIRIELEGAANEARLRLPPRAVAQAIRSLLKNAQEAAPEAAEVVLRAAARADGLEVEVRDQGPGMPEPVLARAGEPFFTTKPAGKGMGLGLFLTRAVLERLGGELRLESARGRGTIARVRLPAVPPATIRRIAAAP